MNFFLSISPLPLIFWSTHLLCPNFDMGFLGISSCIFFLVATVGFWLEPFAQRTPVVPKLFPIESIHSLSFLSPIIVSQT